nr:immunoglobulin heavy chain junction region [Macaca mulatta]
CARDFSIKVEVILDYNSLDVW